MTKKNCKSDKNKGQISDIKMLADVNLRTEGYIIGYARVSTPKQKIERQVQNILSEYPDAYIVREVYTGSKMERPMWKKVLHLVRKGEVRMIVFDEVSRMARDADEGFMQYCELYGKYGVSLVFLKEHYIDTDTLRNALKSQIEFSISSGDAPTDELMRAIIDALNRYALTITQKQIEMAFEAAERELLYLHKRTSEGIMQAKLEGKQIGRRCGIKIETKKAKRSKKVIRKYYKRFGGDLPAKDVMTLCGISKNTFYRYVGEMMGAALLFSNLSSKY